MANPFMFATTPQPSTVPPQMAFAPSPFASAMQQQQPDNPFMQQARSATGLPGNCFAPVSSNNSPFSGVSMTPQQTVPVQANPFAPTVYNSGVTNNVFETTSTQASMSNPFAPSTPTHIAQQVNNSVYKSDKVPRNEKDLVETPPSAFHEVPAKTSKEKKKKKKKRVAVQEEVDARQQESSNPFSKPMSEQLDSHNLEQNSIPIPRDDESTENHSAHQHETISPHVESPTQHLPGDLNGLNECHDPETVTSKIYSEEKIHQEVEETEDKQDVENVCEEEQRLDLGKESDVMRQNVTEDTATIVESNQTFETTEDSVIERKQSFPQCEPVKISTGDAIFANIPVGDISSTGASIFGLSNESGSNTTGATLFEIKAPDVEKPALGEMSGWDETFDRKFNLANLNEGAEDYEKVDDAFISSPYVNRSDIMAQSIFGVDTGFTDSFGDRNFTENPFVEGEANGGESMIDASVMDDESSKPLEDFPRSDLATFGDGWEFMIRYPAKKKITSQRYWKKIFLRIVLREDKVPHVILYEKKDSDKPFQEIPLEVGHSLSDISHQVFDQYSKIFTIKLQLITYKERTGIRPGQINKMQKLTGKISFLAKAVEDADYQGVKEFASDMKKLGVPIEHAPQVNEVLKVGSSDNESLREFSACIEEHLFRLQKKACVRITPSVPYKTEEIQMNAVEEIYVEQDKSGKILKHLVRVRIMFLSFLSEMPTIELGVNEMARMGLEVVGRHDILPVPTEQWIHYEDMEFHSIVDKKAFDKQDHIIRFQPRDACYVELLRFRIRPPTAKELPMQARCSFIITNTRVEIRADMMIPFHHTKAWGQVPCEDVSMRIPLPECWIYQFRTERTHLSLAQLATGNINIGSRMGSVKSSHRRTGKVKGLDRLLGALETSEQDLMETSSGEAKYEHQHKSIVWRVPRLPKHGQGSYTNHEFVCKLNLSSYDKMPEEYEKHFYVDFTQPATATSNTVLRSVSILDGATDQDEQPVEKCVKYLARHEYKLEIDFCEKESNSYAMSARVVKQDHHDGESGDGTANNVHCNDDSAIDALMSGRGGAIDDDAYLDRPAGDEDDDETTDSEEEST